MLTYPNKDGALEFSRELIARAAQQRELTEGPEEIFGDSVFDSDYAEEAGELDYPLLLTYRRLAERDPSFAEYLREKEIDLDDLEQLSSEQRSAWLRKPRSVVVVREFYGFDVRGRGRSRKRPTVYTGLGGIIAMLEGNARWLKGITDHMLDAYQEQKDKQGGPKELDRATQARLLDGASEAFLNYLRMIPSPVPPEISARFGPRGILEHIADPLSEMVVAGTFRPDPPGTFNVPPGLDEGILASLRLLIHAGAIVHVPREENETVLGPLEGKRFRIAYLVAPSFPSPLRLGKEISLASLLAAVDVSQPDLFAEEEEAEDR
jgi:hypothetical protein